MASSAAQIQIKMNHETHEEERYFFLAFALGLVNKKNEQQIWQVWQQKGTQIFTDYDATTVYQVEQSFRALLSQVYRYPNHYSLKAVSALAIKISHANHDIAESITIAFIAMSLVKLEDSEQAILTGLSDAIKGFRAFKQQQDQIDEASFNPLFQAAKVLESNPIDYKSAVRVAQRPPCLEQIARSKNDKLYEQLKTYNATFEGLDPNLPALDVWLYMKVMSLRFSPKVAHVLRSSYLAEIIRQHNDQLTIDETGLKKGITLSTQFKNTFDFNLLFYFSLGHKLSQNKPATEALSFAQRLKELFNTQGHIGTELDFLDKQTQRLFCTFLIVLRFSVVKFNPTEGLPEIKPDRALDVHQIYKDLPLLQRVKQGRLTGFTLSHAAQILMNCPELTSSERTGLLTSFQLLSKKAYERTVFCDPETIEALKIQSNKKIKNLWLRQTFNQAALSDDPESMLREFVSDVIKKQHEKMALAESAIRSYWDEQKKVAFAKNNAQFAQQLSQAQARIQQWGERTREETHKKIEKKLFQTAAAAVVTYLVAPQLAKVITDKLAISVTSNLPAMTGSIVNAGCFAIVSTAANAVATNNYRDLHKQLFKELAMSCVAEAVSLTAANKIKDFSAKSFKINKNASSIVQAEQAIKLQRIHAVSKAGTKAGAMALMKKGNMPKQMLQSFITAAAVETVGAQLNLEENSSSDQLARLGVSSISTASMNGTGNLLQSAADIFSTSFINEFAASQIASSLKSNYPELFRFDDLSDRQAKSAHSSQPKVAPRRQQTKRKQAQKLAEEKEIEGKAQRDRFVAKYKEQAHDILFGNKRKASGSLLFSRSGKSFNDSMPAQEADKNSEVYQAALRLQAEQEKAQNRIDAEQAQLNQFTLMCQKQLHNRELKEILFMNQGKIFDPRMPRRANTNQSNPNEPFVTQYGSESKVNIARQNLLINGSVKNPYFISDQDWNQSYDQRNQASFFNQSSERSMWSVIADNAINAVGFAGGLLFFGGAGNAWGNQETSYHQKTESIQQRGLNVESSYNDILPNLENPINQRKSAYENLGFGSYSSDFGFKTNRQTDSTYPIYTQYNAQTPLPFEYFSNQLASQNLLEVIKAYRQPGEPLDGMAGRAIKEFRIDAAINAFSGFIGGVIDKAATYVVCMPESELRISARFFGLSVGEDATYSKKAFNWVKEKVSNKIIRDARRLSPQLKNVADYYDISDDQVRFWQTSAELALILSGTKTLARGVSSRIQRGCLSVGDRWAAARMAQGSAQEMEVFLAGFNNAKNKAGTAFSRIPASSVNAQIALSKKLRALQKAQKTAVKIENLPDGRIRYHTKERSSKKLGSTRGASYVTEYNPKTNRVRSWFECYDYSGNVNRIHPKMIDGQNVISNHYPPIKSELQALTKKIVEGINP